MKEQNITAARVQAEHLAEVNEWAHWAYLIGVFTGSTLLMLALIGILGSSQG